MSDQPKKKVYGIDLGTTYSAISYIDDTDKAAIINNREGGQITASAVYFDDDGSAIIGEVAKDSGKMNPDRIVELIKRDMGTKTTREIMGKEYSPENISAIILRDLVKSAAESGHEVKDVVITCPAYFGLAEREATKNAGIMAGLNVIQVLDEPIGAALSYNSVKEPGMDKTVIVYDLGGGTFDVTIVRLTENEIRILCTDGNHRLGGADWDARLEALIAQKFMEQCPSAGDPRDDPESAYDLHVETEKIKKNLSAKTKVSKAISHGGERANVTVTREEFNLCTRDLLDETINFTNKMIEFAREKKDVTKFDEFLLVGGSTRMSQVMERVTAEYSTSLGVEPKVFDPDLAVSKGAAVYGTFWYKEIPEPTPEPILGGVVEPYSIDGTTKTPTPSGPTITFAASKSYGIKVRNKKTDELVCYNMIPKQSEVHEINGYVFSNVFGTSADNATELPLVVFSNDNPEQYASLDMCTEVGVATMILKPGLPAGAPIFVEFKLTKEGLLSVRAEDQTHHEKVEAEFTLTDALTQEELQGETTRVAEIVIQD